jgi:hypothetical protein
MPRLPLAVCAGQTSLETFKSSTLSFASQPKKTCKQCATPLGSGPGFAIILGIWPTLDMSDLSVWSVPTAKADWAADRSI